MARESISFGEPSKTYSRVWVPFHTQRQSGVNHGKRFERSWWRACFPFYPDSDYWGWIITGQIDGVWDTWNPGPEEVASKIDEVIMLKVKFDKNAFRPVEYVNDEELHDEFMVEGTIPPKNIEFMGNLQDGISQTYASTPIDNPPDPFFPGDAVKKYPWLRHADLIQQNRPGIHLGSYRGKKVGFRPYYQSTGSSPASGTGA